MKNIKKNNKLKKVSEKARLEKLLLQLIMMKKSSEERILRYEDLTKRSLKESPSEKHTRNLGRLDEARKNLQESLVLLDHVSDTLEKLKKDNKVR